MCPVYGCPENFRESLSTYTATFADIFNGLLFRLPIDPINMRTKSEVPEIIGGYSKNLRSPWLRPRSLFSKIFNWLLFGFGRTL